MTELYPFTDPNPGWADGKKLRASEMIKVSANAAQAADGRLWSDVALVKNIRKSTFTGGGAALMWDGFTKRWITGGTSGGSPAGFYSFDGTDDWVALTIPAGTNWNATQCGASNNAGVVILCGGGGSATASKIRQSVDGGWTWTAKNTVASSTQFVSCCTWHAGSSLFVIGLSSAASTNIETSPDGSTWTQVTGLPNSLARGGSASNGTSSGVASNGSVLVMLAASSTNKCLRSTDGATWTESTLPATKVWGAVAWNARASLFMAIAPDAIATSPDGTTWSSSGLVVPPFSPTPTSAMQVGSLAAIGRLWVAAGSETFTGVTVSLDGAAWTPVKATTSLLRNACLGDNQVCLASPGVAYASLRGGL